MIAFERSRFLKKIKKVFKKIDTEMTAEYKGQVLTEAKQTKRRISENYTAQGCRVKCQSLPIERICEEIFFVFWG